MSEYAIYRGDSFQFIGTAEEAVEGKGQKTSIDYYYQYWIE
ncbi:hypothetical protein [Enterococcus hirae]|nr:hypothetical protein [Enterococcus hirae]